MSSCEHTLNTLRYADRVKELGASDPAKSSPMDQRESDRGGGQMPDVRMDDGVMSPEDSDLAQLRSLNEGELSADWYNFQEIISHLQALEEDLVESHRTVIDGMQQWVQDDANLLSMTNAVDYDQDGTDQSRKKYVAGNLIVLFFFFFPLDYCRQLEDMIDEKIDALTALRAKAKTFRKTLNDEEAKSRMLQHK